MEKEQLKETKVIKTPSAYPYYIAGLFWVGGSFLFPMYKLSSLFLCGGLACLGWFVGTKLFPAKEEVVEVIKEEEYASEAVKQTVEEGIRLLDELKEVNRKIQHEKLSKQIDEIEEVASQILIEIKNKPGSVGSIRKFINYYFPTTIKLLNQYSELEKQNIKVENVQSSMEKIEKMMNLITKAFNSQLDNLYEGDAIDISSEITVMEDMMQAEGLIKSSSPSKGGM